MLAKIHKCARRYRLLYSSHARQEMELEEPGRIRQDEVFEALIHGRIIEDYPEDKPYHSCVIFGKTSEDRPLHIVCAYAEEDDAVIVITACEADAGQLDGCERKLK